MKSVLKTLTALLLLSYSKTVFAWQTYVPPPPPKLPEVLSEKMVAMGKALFEENILSSQGLEIYNYLGNQPCSACHDKKNRLRPKSLANKFKDLPAIINKEIIQRSAGIELPPQDPAMEALVQYMIQKYRLDDYKLLK